ncbi:hypothetical protein [Brucella intermedia]|uniref:hypothetical protein n=2 Tax=Brucella/Ochrobactrum group TaxID=2826938 RepID=UPI003F5CDFFC
MLAVIAASVPVTQALAANQVFDPLRFSLSRDRQQDILHIYNDQDYPVEWTARVVEWTMEHDGRNIFKETSDIIVWPRKIELKSHTSGKLKLSIDHFKPWVVEGSYRIILQSSAIESGFGNVVHHFSMPVFVEPLSSVRDSSVKFASHHPGQISITLSNHGTHHLFVKSIDVVGTDADQQKVFSISRNGWYVLPGLESTYTLNISDEDCNSVKNIQASFIFREGVKRVVERNMAITCNKEEIQTGFK